MVGANWLGAFSIHSLLSFSKRSVAKWIAVINCFTSHLKGPKSKGPGGRLRAASYLSVRPQE